MKTEVEKLEGNKVRLKVEVPSKVLDTAVRDAYKDLAKRLWVPGFRKGKVPQQVIDAKVGREAVMARAAETIITTRYPEALVRSGVDPVEQPEVNIVQAETGKDLIFEADIEVKPEAKLGEYKDLTVTVESAQVTDEEIEEQIDILRQRFARLDVVEDRPVEVGDYVLIDYAGTIDGKPWDGSASEDYMVEIGSGTLFAEIEEGIVGMKRGDAGHVNLKIPDDFRVTEVAGKEAKFDVAVKEIKKKVLPDLDDDFVSESTEHDTVAGLKDELRRKLEVVRRAQTKIQAEQKVVETVVANAEVEVPDKLVGMELDDMLEELNRNLQRQGANVEEYLKITNSTMEKLREELTEEAKNRIGRELAIIAVAKAENLEVSREEMDSEIVQIAQALQKPVPEVQSSIAEKGTLPELHATLLRRKTIDWLREHSRAATESGEPVDLSPPAEAVVGEEPEAQAAPSVEPVPAGDEGMTESPAGVEESESQAAQETQASEEAALTSGEGETSE